MIKTNKIESYVNCPMRTYKAFSFIKKEFIKKFFLSRLQVLIGICVQIQFII